jgi:hypothetical protein
MIALLAAAALAAEPARLDPVAVVPRSPHFLFRGSHVHPTGVGVAVQLRAREVAVKLEPLCDPLAVHRDGEGFFAGVPTGKTKPVRLSVDADRIGCTWSGAFRASEGSGEVPALPGHYQVVMRGKVNGGPIAPGGSVAWPLELVKPRPIGEGVMRLLADREFVASADGQLVVGFVGPGPFGTGFEMAELRVWVEGVVRTVWLSRAKPGDRTERVVVGGHEVSLVSVLPDGELAVDLRVVPRSR